MFITIERAGAGCGVEIRSLVTGFDAGTATITDSVPQEDAGLVIPAAPYPLPAAPLLLNMLQVTAADPSEW